MNRKTFLKGLLLLPILPATALKMSEPKANVKMEARVRGRGEWVVVRQEAFVPIEGSLDIEYITITADAL